MSVYDRAADADDATAYIPADLRLRMLSVQHTPMHEEIQERSDTTYDEIRRWSDLDDLIMVDDEFLLEYGGEDARPVDEHGAPLYDEDELLKSRSSGTTGEPKEIYWHIEDIEDNVDYMAAQLEEAGFPEDTHWVMTATPNEVLQYTLEAVAERFDSEATIIEVDPAPVKQALMSAESEEEIAAVFDPLAEQVTDAFEEYDVGVYEDIAPLMQYVSPRLSEEHREQVEGLLIGGVGTTEELVDDLTTNHYPNATLTGWHGDYNTGFSMMSDPGTLEYVPDAPDVRFEVRDFDDIRQEVDDGEEGVLVSHTFRRGFFVPNRVIGDMARRVDRDGVTAITDIGRMEE